jgi:hypothetical protein
LFLKLFNGKTGSFGGTIVGIMAFVTGCGLVCKKSWGRGEPPARRRTTERSAIEKMIYKSGNETEKEQPVPKESTG